MSSCFRRSWFVAGLVTVTGGATLALSAPAHPSIAILTLRAEAPAPRAYASAFRSVGYPVRWVTPEDLGSVNGSVLVVPRAAAGRLDAGGCRSVSEFVESGGRLVTAGDSRLSRALGVRFSKRKLRTDAIRDTAAPVLPIRWTSPATFPRFRTPTPARIFARTVEQGHPVVSAFSHGRGAVLFLGVELEDESPLGTGRFPYFLQAAGEGLGIAPPVALRRVVAYADISDHRGQDPADVARVWYARGIREVHVGAWDAFGTSEDYFSRLIAACHSYGILVYAWLEPPEVSTAFWDAHPEWREKTATGADARVDWRRLMALNIPECFDAVARGIDDLLQRLDWDGVDLAEVYFESPTGLEASRLFTPMNRPIREEFSKVAGFDPRELFVRSSPRFWRRDRKSLETFLEFRRAKVIELHERLMSLLASVRVRKPHLDLVLTLVDALYDTRMRDLIGIDTPRITALAAGHSFALQVEDPYTLWALGPERYARIGADYARLVPSGQHLSVDINVVPRGGDVRPTAQQTGLELYRLVSEARRSFFKVCFYSEGTIYPQDSCLLPCALASTARVEMGGSGATVESDQGVELAIGDGPYQVLLDGVPWPALRNGAALIPPGQHEVAWRAGRSEGSTLQLRDINAVLLGASSEPGALTVRYLSPARAFLVLSFRPARVEVDGAASEPQLVENEHGTVLIAPPGEHLVRMSP